MAKRTKADRIEEVRERIVPVEEAEPFVKVLVYGRSGAGKTRFSASGPSPLVVDINEKGTRSIRNYKGAAVYPVRSWPDLTYVYWFLREGDHEYQTVILDTLTAAQHMCMRHVLNEAEDRDPNREPSMPDRRSWGKLGELMKPMIYNFRNLPMHTVFVCQERIMSEEDPDMPGGHVPDLSPSVRGVAMAAVEVMGRIYQKEVRAVDKAKKRETKKWETRMLVGPHDQYETKDRTGQLGRIITNPTMGKIIDASFEEDN